MNALIKNFLAIFLILLVISGIFSLFSLSFEVQKTLPFTDLVQQINQGGVKKIVVSGNNLLILYQDDTKALSYKEMETSLSQSLINYGVDKEQLKTVSVETQESKSEWLWLLTLLSSLAPLLLFGFFFWMIFKQSKAGAMQTFDFTKAKARLFGAGGPPKQRITFKDVAGSKEAKEELKEIVDFLKNPKKYLKMGARIPRGVLLVGPSGVGKTLLARAIAGESNVPFFSISGSEFVELFVGVGASVTKDTPILIKTNNSTKLIPIGEFVDQFYEKNEEGSVVPISGVKTLGYKPLKTRFSGASENSPTKFFGESCWQNVKGVYRHKVNEIYKIEYLGGNIRTTGDHSVFIRHHNFITAKKVSELEAGDILVNLPFKVRGAFKLEIGTTHKVKAHQFEEISKKELPLWNRNSKVEQLREDYAFVCAKQGEISQYDLADQIGVSQTTISNWQRDKYQPRGLWLAEQYLEKEIPQKIKISPELMRLLGYYTAEGRRTDYMVQLVFGAHEKKLHKDCVRLIKNLFNLDATLEKTKHNSLRISFFNKALADFFEKYCGNGSHNKRIPEFLWDLPKQYFLEYLKGFTKGDGYTTQEGKLVASSVSKQLILELSWLCAMHGIQVGIDEKYNKPGRVIKKGRDPLPGNKYWLLIIGKTSHPFSKEKIKYPKQFKKPYIKKISKENYEGYVYDLCGCKNEAFFGGEKPTLFHNSRARDLFATAKKVGTSIIFIDELDAVGRVRGTGIGGGHDEREQTLNQILVEMDGFERDDTRIVVAASITGDTPVLVKNNEASKLLQISKVIDPYYGREEEGVEKPADGLMVLGFERKIGEKNASKKNIYFENSAFKKVRSVFRHRINEVYEIEYNGGKIKTTGNHSVFIRTPYRGLKPKLVSELKAGDILVNLPFKVNRTTQKREIRAYKFNKEFNLELPVWQPLFEKDEIEAINLAYQYALAHVGEVSQTRLGESLGFSQRTIGKWQQGICGPRILSKNYYQHKNVLPEKIKVTPELMRLFGYYVAEGYARKELDFCLNRNEKEKIEDIKDLMKKIFHLEPSRERFITSNAINIIYYSKPLADFFGYHCGKGAKNKHVPQFLFEVPFEYFREFFRGYLNGDGYIDKRGRGEVTSVSKQLILELNWLFGMHGFKSYIHSFKAKAGRRIHNGKPLKRTIAWRLGFGKTQNPLNKKDLRIKGSVYRPIVKNVKKVPHDGYVYDFCGCENEAFFAGESPILAHNTNRPDVLDPALLRPGRFDRKIVLDLPDIDDRDQILKIHCQDKPLALNVNLREVAERTPGFSGADLANVVNEAALLAARKNKNQVFQEELLESIEKVLLGPERKSHILSKKEKEIAAFHEAGHALVASFVPTEEPVRKVSIVARGMAAGYTLKVPTEEKKMTTKSEFLNEMVVLLAGFSAEKIKFGEITTGAANDLKRATELARDIVTQYGMSSLGPITFGKKEELVFLGKEISEQRTYSEKVAAQIDKEVAKFVKDANKKAENILKKKKSLLEKIARTLIKKETIERKEFEELIGKKEVKKRGEKSGPEKPLIKREKSISVKIGRV